MNPSDFIRKKTREWITKAENGLRSAEILLDDPDPPTDTACYYCQQAVEKYIKALLTSCQIEFTKSHDLDYLSKLVSPKIDIADYKEDMVSLSKYAIEPRYPADLPIYYPVEEAKQAPDKAKEIIAFLKKILNG